MEKTTVLAKIEKEIERLSPREKLRIVEKLILQLRKSGLNNKKELDWNELYGLGKNLWHEDAQKYVNRLRVNRI